MCEKQEGVHRGKLALALSILDNAEHMIQAPSCNLDDAIREVKEAKELITAVMSPHQFNILKGDEDGRDKTEVRQEGREIPKSKAQAENGEGS